MYKKILLLSAAFPFAAQAETPRVVADIAPLHSLVSQVMEGVATPELLLPPTLSPHHYSLRPSDARKLSDATLVFWMGEALTPWLKDPVETLAVDAAHIEMMALEETEKRPWREELHAGHDDHHDEEEHDDDHHDHDHDEDHAEHEEHEEHDDHGDHDDHHHVGDADPHAWLDPDNALIWLPLIAAELSKADPENADTYSQNATNAAAEIRTLSAEIEAKLDAVHEQPFIVFHDAYQYFEGRFDLTIVGAIGESDADTPGAARIAALRDVVADKGVRCLFTEPQFNEKTALTVSEGLSVSLATLDPLGAEVATGPDHYATLLQNMGDAFANCLSDG